MKIAVCMKQVPAYSEGDMDEKTGLIIRAGLQAIVNIYDLSALETALQIKDRIGASVTVFTMGPINAGQVIREAYACGADAGYLISDRAFGGADVLATSYTLMQAIKSTGNYDLILCGKQTTDGDTGQVSGALAKWLDIPHITRIVELVNVDQDMVTVKSMTENQIIVGSMKYPCLLAVDRDIFIPRMPSLKLKMTGKKKALPIITVAELLDQDEAHYGLQGSATRVRKIFPPERAKKHEVKYLEGEAAATYIKDMLDKIECVKGIKR